MYRGLFFVQEYCGEVEVSHLSMLPRQSKVMLKPAQAVYQKDNVVCESVGRSG
jgi:hypothetical protein